MLNKSYVIIDFETLEQKLFTISEEYRLFGFKYGKIFLFTENADYKTTIIVNNIKIKG